MTTSEAIFNQISAEIKAVKTNYEYGTCWHKIEAAHTNKQITSTEANKLYMLLNTVEF